jgi:hypothetical protein
VIGRLTLKIGAESRFALDWYQTTGAIGELIAALKAGEDVTDQTAIAHLPAIRSAVKGLEVACVHVLAEIPFVLRPVDKLLWARDKPEGPERWRIRRYPVIDAATAEQAAMFYVQMYGVLLDRVCCEREATCQTTGSTSESR